jgi:hypothetical protein
MYNNDQNLTPRRDPNTRSKDDAMTTIQRRQGLNFKFTDAQFNVLVFEKKQHKISGLK